MPDYSTRPGAPNENGREAVDRLERGTAAARRDRPRPESQPTLVQLGLEEVDSWPPGTTRLVGDDYPFEVKLTDGTWLPIPATASGGGVVGMAELIATSGSVVWNAGSSTFSYDGVTYSTIRDPNAGSGGGETKAPISSWLTVNGYEITLAPGWYIPVLNMRILWPAGGAPAAFGGPYMQGGGDIAHNDSPIHVKTPLSASGAGLWQIANYGPTYMGAGAVLYAQSWAIGGAPTAGNAAASSAITWNITKLG